MMQLFMIMYTTALQLSRAVISRSQVEHLDMNTVECGDDWGHKQDWDE